MSDLANKGLTGLINLGNSCYMNTILQCLSNTDLLLLFLNNKLKNENINKNDKGVVLSEFKRLIDGIWSENCTISPNSFHTIFRKYSLKYDHPNFVDLRQNDAHEFLNLLLDILHEGISKKVNITISGIVENEIDEMALNAMKSWKDFFKSSYSDIIDIFFGQFISEITDIEGNVLSKIYDPFPSISIEIPNLDNISIYDCLNHFISYEILDGDNKYYYSKQKEYITAKKNIKLWNSPKILIINFKRFEKVNDFITNKNCKYIDFPINNLNLVKYCIGYDKFESVYDLYAICNHSGGTTGGHYFAYCKNKNNQWYEYNDKFVRKIDESDLVTNNAYCLFYQKKKT